ncbi:MAG: cytochrome c biogenesis protein ResB [Phycisphaerae bacterium]|nr:cytochrome c biogenesis protein ResB [Phycisphaerae bacterium]
MSIHYEGVFRRGLKVVGSLWFAAVLLVMLMLAMACATIFESANGTPQAKFAFYQAPWFQALLLLFAVNVTAAALVRFPYSRKHVGFLLTHAGLVITVLGAWITYQFAVDANLGLVEGEASRKVMLRDVDTLTLTNRETGASQSVDLVSRDFHAFDKVQNPSMPALALGDVTVGVDTYLPNSTKTETLKNDNPRFNPAVLVELDGGDQAGHSHGEQQTWLLANQAKMLGMRPAAFRVMSSRAEWDRVRQPAASSGEGADGVVHVALGDVSYDIALAEALTGKVSVGETPYSVQVLRYLPHANVGPNNTLINVSDRPENPAIILELTGPKGTEERKAFANFPDFASMHGDSAAPEVKITFSAPSGASDAGTTPIEIIAGPDGEMVARFTPESGPATVRDIALNEPIVTPWPGTRIVVREYYPNARRDTEVTQLDASPNSGVVRPALELAISRGSDRSTMWIQKYDNPKPFTVDGVTYDVTYTNKEIDLGFTVRLDKFTIGFYPGGRRPRSFESRITILDPAAGGEQARVVSMNHPTTYGGYSFFQSSYRMDRGRTASFLSVSRDPGQLVVYLGYLSTFVGMIVVLVQRMSVRKQQGRSLPIGIGVCESGEAVGESGGRRLMSAPVPQGNGKAAGTRRGPVTSDRGI